MILRQLTKEARPEIVCIAIRGEEGRQENYTDLYVRFHKAYPRLIVQHLYLRSAGATNNFHGRPASLRLC